MSFPIKKSPITNFCENKGIPRNMRDAFGAYVRTTYANRFDVAGDTDTIRLLVNRLSDEQMEQAWNEFVSDMRKALEK